VKSVGKSPTRNVLFLLGYPRLTCQARLAGVYRSAAVRGFRVRVIENAYVRKDLDEVVSFWNPIGMIVSCGYGTGDFDVRTFRHLPTIYYDNDPFDCCTDRWACVKSDSRQIGELAAHELSRLDSAHFAFVPHAGDFHWSRKRGEYFAKAVQTATGCSVTTFPARSFVTPMARLKALSSWLWDLPRPCGVFAANDLVAEEVEQAAEYAGLRLPRDLALIGVDNQEQLCSTLPVPLTSIQMDFEQGGYIASEKLDGLIRGTLPSGGVFRYPALRTVSRLSTRTTSTPADVFADCMTSFIREHVETGVSIEAVVRESGYSRRQAEKLFRQGAGKSILTAIHDAVYDRACVLAKKRDFPIAAVADALGGISRSQLDRIFVARTGLTLRAWLERD